uniref:Coiled-coil domain-containing protein n=1 Tax=Schistosoma mansoni TaxID=6183 RepID=A0A3Q0KQC5_SCHMA
MKDKKRGQVNLNLQKKIENLEMEISKYKQDHDADQPLLCDYRVLEKRFDETKRDLDVETLLRADLENKIPSIKSVERGSHIEKAVEVCKQAEYESPLTEELRSIRDQTASELEEYKIQMEEIFNSKLGQLKSPANSSDEDASHRWSELFVARKCAKELSHDLFNKIAELESL